MPRLLCGLLLCWFSCLAMAASEQLLVLDHQVMARDITHYLNPVQRPETYGAPQVVTPFENRQGKLQLEPRQQQWLSLLVSNQSGKERPLWLVPDFFSPLEVKVYRQSEGELLLMEPNQGFYYLKVPAGYSARLFVSLNSSIQQSIRFKLVDSHLLPEHLPSADAEILVYGLLFGMALYGALFGIPSVLLRCSLLVCIVFPLLALMIREQYLHLSWNLPTAAVQWLFLAIWSLVVVWVCRLLGKPVALSKWLVRGGNVMLPIHLLVFSSFLILEPRFSWLFAAAMIGSQFVWLSQVRRAYDMAGLQDPGPLHLSLLPVMLWCIAESLVTFDGAESWMISSWWLNRILVFMTVLLLGNAFFRRQQMIWQKQELDHKSEKLNRREQGKQLAKVAKESLQRRKEAEQARIEARTDALTGLLNRKALEEDLLQIRLDWDHQQRKDHLLMAIDLDGMKNVNDSLGHAEGDRMLQIFAASMQTMFRAEDRLYRTGGDEFVALLGVQDSRQARRRLDLALVSTREQGFQQIGLSAGTVLLSECSGNVDQAMTVADNRMYQEKKHKPSHRGVYPR